MACVLVVDVERYGVSALKDLLEDDGHEVRAFTAGAEAVGALAVARFDAVLTELRLSAASGETVVEAARQSRPRPCIFVTSADAKAHLGAVDGVRHVFDKPIDYRRLAQAVSECAGGSQREGSRTCYLKCQERSRQ
jgi:two-component system response regulator ChvI